MDDAFSMRGTLRPALRMSKLDLPMLCLSVRVRFAIFLFLLILAPFEAPALTNNIALTPQMGFNDWNAYGCNINQGVITNTASLMAANGMLAAGYQYVNIDDGWAATRDSNGVIQAYSISGKFPQGIPWLANYVHGLGMKLGLYTDHGTNTCSSCIETSINPVGKDPGSFDYEYIDAFTYALWGADYLKNDSCNLPNGDSATNDYFRIADGLMKSGRPIFVSLCENAPHYEYWSPNVGNSWRAVGDITHTFSSMISKIDQNSKSAYLAGPGRWNDPDMLEIGNGEFATNFVGAQTHFTMWCIMAAPLLVGTTMSSIQPQSLAILTNTEAIAVDQDPAGEQGERVGGIVDSAEVWSKPLGYDFTTRAVALLNRSSNSSANITCNFTNLAFQPGTTATVRDLVAHQNLGTFTNSFSANIPAYGSMLLKIVGTPISPPSSGTNYLSAMTPVYAYVASNGVFMGIKANKTIAGNTITLGGVSYTNGLGVCAMSGVEYNLGGICSSFQATIGIDHEVGNNGSVIFQVFADGTRIYNSPIMTGASTPISLNLDMTGVRRLILGVTDTGNDVTDSSTRDTDCDSDWANALLVVTNTTPQPPEIPTGFTANPGIPTTLSWNNTLAALTYNVKRGTHTGGPYTNIANVPITTFADSNVVAGTPYYYVVSAVSSLGEGSNSTEVNATACNVPAPPAGVTTSATSSQIVVNWSGSTGATSYNVYRFTPDTPPVQIGSSVTTSYTDGGLSPNTTNYYLVTAANACNTSGYSAYAPGVTPPGPPATPTGLAAAPGDTEVSLTWNTSGGATGYNVGRSTANGGPYSIIATNIPGAACLDFNVTNGVTYYYVVAALNGGGVSPNSSQVSVTPTAPVTAYWTNTATGTAQNWTVNANWTNVSAYPNSGGDLVVINTGLAASQTINLNQAITVGSLKIGDANGVGRYTLAANGGSLAFNDVNPVSITQVASSQGDVLAAPISIQTNLTVINNSVNPLTLAGNLSAVGGAALTIGSGVLQVGDGTTNGSLGAVDVTNNVAINFNRGDNATNKGVISGSGNISQNGQGTGILTISGANTFTGTTTIQNGTLQMNTNTAFGPATGGAVIITNGGTLDIGGPSYLNQTMSLGTKQIHVSGWGVSSNGAIVNNGSTYQYANNNFVNITMQGDTAIGGAGQAIPGNGNTAGRWDFRGTSSEPVVLSTSGHPWNLIKMGGNQIVMVYTQVDPALGNIDVRQGMLELQGTTTLGNSASNLTVEAGATFGMFQATGTLNKNFILNGNGVADTIWSEGSANTIAGPITLNSGTSVFGCASGKNLTLSGPVTGPGGLLVNTAAATTSVTLAGVNNSYTGSTTVTAGTLALAAFASISNTPVITVKGGATLDASAGTTLTLASGQTLTGNGAVKGNVVVGSGATFAPGGSLSTMTLSNNLTLGAGSTTVVEISKSPVSTNDSAQVVGTVTYGGTLVVTNISAGAYSATDSFKLFNATSYPGAFSNIVPAIPAVNLAWNTNTLSTGVLSVMPSPTRQPEIGSMSMTGNGMVLAGSNGVANWTYYVLASTNAASPLSNWSIFSTNSFDASGNFNLTNPLNPSAPQTFFMLKLH
jgi:autotransporter-associated beta strand protein